MLSRDRRHRLDGIEIAHPRYYYPPGILRSCYGHCFLQSIRSCTLEMACEFRPDIILGSWAYPDGYAAVRLAKQLNIPVAVQVLGSDVNLLDRFPARRRETWKSLHSADAVITVSQDLANKIIHHGIDSRRVKVVYRGMNKSVFFPGSQREARSELKMGDASPKLLFIGNLVPVKAVDVLITACALLQDCFPQLQLHIIGDGPLRKSLQAQAAAISIDNRVHFHGVVPHGQLPMWYRAADLLVLPSLAEGVPNVLLESIACGRPYVASDTGGIPEISNHAGCALVVPGNPQALANAIAEKIRDGTAPTPADLRVESWDESGRVLGRVLDAVARGKTHGHIGLLATNQAPARL